MGKMDFSRCVLIVEQQWRWDQLGEQIVTSWVSIGGMRPTFWLGNQQHSQLYGIRLQINLLRLGSNALLIY